MPMVTNLPGTSSSSNMGIAPGASHGPTAYGADQEEIAKTQAEAAKYPYLLKQQRFNTVFPWLQGQIGGMSKSPYTIGGQSPAGPDITAGPVWNDQQIQQKVNAGKASVDQQTQTAQRTAAAGAAGRGFGGTSPLVQALQGQLAGQGLAAKAGQEQQTRWGAAQGNAQQMLSSQNAREGQFASRQQESIQRAKPYFDLQQALIGTLGGMI